VGVLLPGDTNSESETASFCSGRELVLLHTVSFRCMLGGNVEV
jgi:hypothetical protein